MPRKKPEPPSPERQMHLEALKEDLGAIAERFEDAQKALSLEARPCGVLLSNTSHYQIAIDGMREGKVPSYGTLRAIADFFVGKGYRLPWLLLGMPPERAEVGGAPDLVALETEYLPKVPERYRKKASSAVATLIRRKWDPEAAWDSMRRIALKETSGDVFGPLDLVDAAEVVLYGEGAPKERVWGPGEDGESKPEST